MISKTNPFEFDEVSARIPDPKRGRSRNYETKRAVQTVEGFKVGDEVEYFTVASSHVQSGIWRKGVITKLTHQKAYIKRSDAETSTSREFGEVRRIQK